MQKILIIIGCILIVIGILYPWIIKSGLGRLPGDIYIKKENVTFYFPIVTCIVLSVIISLIIYFLRK